MIQRMNLMQKIKKYKISNKKQIQILIRIKKIRKEMNIQRIIYKNF